MQVGGKAIDNWLSGIEWATACDVAERFAIIDCRKRAGDFHASGRNKKYKTTKKVLTSSVQRRGGKSIRPAADAGVDPYGDIANIKLTDMNQTLLDNITDRLTNKPTSQRNEVLFFATAHYLLFKKPRTTCQPTDQSLSKSVFIPTLSTEK